MPLETRVGDDRRAVGTAWDSPEMRENMLSSLENVAAAVADGLFTLRDTAVWQFVMVFESLDDWNDLIEGTGCGGTDADPEVLAVAFDDPDGRLVLTEDDVAQVLVRA